MGGEKNNPMDVGQDWICFDGEKEYGGEKDEVLWPHRPKKTLNSITKTDTGEVEAKR